jgi:hypothetical protein
VNDAPVSLERKRGCGFRKAGGLYLVGPPGGLPCGRLPFELERCAGCGHGVKQSRGWTWVQPAILLGLPAPKACGAEGCSRCPLGAGMPERTGLIWIGRKFYPTPGEFLAEGQRMGFSRRISALPRGFKLGEDWILLAHAHALAEWDPVTQQVAKRPGLFAVWKPRMIQEIVTVETSQAEVDAIRKRGHEPVIVVPEVERQLDLTEGAMN